VIHFYYHPTPNPAKVALFLEETGLPYKLIPIDTGKGEQHTAEFRRINPNGKVPAIIDMAPKSGSEVRVFDSTAILIYLADKTGHYFGSAANRPELLSWLMFIASGLGPFCGQAAHFQHGAPDKLSYAINRFRREVERHYTVLDRHLAGRDYLVGDDYSIADMSLWGWLDKAPRVLDCDDPLSNYPNLAQLFRRVDSREAAVRARAVGKGFQFKHGLDEESRRALFPSNYPSVSVP
jgi:GST-like protein